MLKVNYDVTEVRAGMLGEFIRNKTAVTKFDLAVVVGLDYLVNEKLLSDNFPIIGISLGYDINLAFEDSSKAKIVRVNATYMDGLILDSKFSVQQLRKLLAKPLPKYLISPYGADLENFESHPIIIKKPLTIVVTRSWTKLNANHDIVKAMNLMKNNTSIHFLGVSGTYPRVLLENLSQKGFHKVEWYGTFAQSDIPVFLQKGWCYVSAANSDGTSVSLLEAMAAGKISVVSDFPSNLEWISNGVNGFLFKNGNPHSLASVLDDISNMELKDLYVIAQKARETVTTRGRWRVNSEQIMRFIGEFLPVE